MVKRLVGVLGVVLLFLLAFTVPLCTGPAKLSGNVAVIPINGMILTTSGGFGAGNAFAGDIISYIEEVDNNGYDAIVFRINSPGGSAVASDEIAAAILKTNTPTVAFIEEVGASGGYWVASAADYVVANRMSITGSIGVISSYLEFSGLMEEYGVGYERLVSGDRKDMGIPFRKLDAVEKHIMQIKLDKIHDYFIEAVAKNRNLTQGEVIALATGEFYLGVEAYERGLVDSLGGIDEVETYLKKEYELEDVIFEVFEKEPTFFDLLAGVTQSFGFSIGRGFGTQLQRGMVV